MPIENKNFANNYIRNIPWSKHPLFAFTKTSAAYIDSIQKSVDKIPYKDMSIDFNNNVWDFNPYFEGINSNSLKFNFQNITDDINTYLKFYVLYNIFGTKKISTTNTRVTCIQSVLKHIIEETNHKSIETITTNDIIQEISKRNTSYSTTHSLYESVYQYYRFVISNYKLNLPVDLKELKKLAVKEKRLGKLNDNKLSSIPQEYFESIVNAATTVMRDKTAEHNYRAIACEIVILSQLGMRLGDVLALTTDRLISTTLKGCGVNVSYIHYKSRKPSKAHDAMLEFDIVSNALTTEAFMTLCKIRQDVPGWENNDYIFTLIPRTDGRDAYKTLPIARPAFNDLYAKFFMKYLSNDCHRTWDGIHERKIPISVKNGILSCDHISLPDTRQYRVYVCTYYYTHGVPLVYIQRFMGHLSEYMLGYYVRPKDTFVENAEVAEKTISSMLVDDNTPIGYMGDELKNRMKDYIANGHVDVKNDIQGAVNAFGDHIIIRSKEGGACVCIKTSFMPCAYDARSNEALCAYGDCINIYRFYYHADITYMDFITATETYQHNSDAGRKLEAQKELMKVKDICRRKLLPQLSELDKEMQKNGKSAVLQKYPSLSEVIEKEDQIKEAVQTWMKK